MITSPSNSKIALLRSLHTAKGREAESLFLLEGPHLLEAAMQARVIPRLVVYDPGALERSVAGRRTLELVADARSKGAEALEATGAALERAADAQTPQGVIAAASIEDFTADRVRARRRGRMRPLMLVLDAIADPGNLGTILRSALAADVDEVLLSAGCADPLAPKVVRSGSGAHFHLPVRPKLTWEQIGEALAGAPAVRQTLAMDSHAQTPYDAIEYTRRTAIIVGNEAHGLSAQAEEFATERVSIPMWNKVESLNAAIAASVILFEAARQRRVAEADEKRQSRHLDIQAETERVGGESGQGAEAID